MLWIFESFSLILLRIKSDALSIYKSMIAIRADRILSEWFTVSINDLVKRKSEKECGNLVRVHGNIILTQESFKAISNNNT